MDYFKQLLILIGVGGVFSIILIYYVIKLERKIVRTLLKNEKRIKRQKEMIEEAQTILSAKN